MVNIILHPIKWSEACMKRLKWYDVKLAQWVSILAVLALITAWPAFLTAVQKIDWYWYLIAAIVFGIPLIKRMFFEK